MPPKYSIKQYLSSGFYHLFNRGVEKRRIFQDKQDYAVFLSYLKTYLEPKNIIQLQTQLANPIINWREKDKILKMLRLNNFFGEINLLCYCLMPNHFHLLIKQKNPNGIEFFMKSIATRYSTYFNRKYKRVGHLFQGIYKAVLIDTDEQLLHLSRYIHLNPVNISTRLILEDCYSSYTDYIGKRNTSWIEKEQILSYFSKTNPHFSYHNFVEENQNTENELISSLLLE